MGSQLNALDQALVAAEARQISLRDTQEILLDGIALLAANPKDEALTAWDHWALLSPVGVVAGWNPGWVALLEAAPTQTSLPADYQAWLAQAEALIRAELALLPSQIESLQAEQAQVSADYEAAADESRALSAGLEIAQIKEQPPEIVHLRPVGTLMLVGGLLGLLAWMTVWLYQITRKTER